METGEKKFWQHRISHMWDVSKQLFDEGYLTIGWQSLVQSNLCAATQAQGEPGFSETAAKEGLTTRNRWCLYRFFTMKPGDVVVVPLYEGEFAIVEVSGYAKPISELPIKELTSTSNRKVGLSDCLRYADTNEIVDLGFFIPFDASSMKVIPRSFASAKLQSRMKHQYINVELEKGIQPDVQHAATAVGPVDLHDIIVEATAKSVLASINEAVTPDGFEHLIQWYMKKNGASRVYIPAKNEPGKEDGADADIVAEFDALGLVFFIQAKKHEGTTDDWAVKQICYYKAQKENTTDDFTYIPWVISTATFEDEVRETAHEAGVRLIDGITFAKMLIETGIESINEVMDYLK